MVLWLSEIRIRLSQEAKQNTNHGRMMYPHWIPWYEIRWISMKWMLKSFHYICSQHGTRQSCVYFIIGTVWYGTIENPIENTLPYHTIENAWFGTIPLKMPSSQFVCFWRSWTMIAAGRSPSKSLLHKRHPLTKEAMIEIQISRVITPVTYLLGHL